MTARQWVRPPRLYRGERQGNERHASWFELFFDLVFVIAVAELAHTLHDDLTFRGLVGFAALFVPIWWQWIDFSYYADQFDSDDVPFLITMLVTMFGVIVLALTIHDALHGGSWAFAATYAALRVIIIGLYFRAWRSVPESRELTTRYMTSFIVALGVWIVSLFVAEPLRFWLWALALLIEIGNGPVTYATIKHVPTQVSHMGERFGLFVIIVLGEAVVSVAGGVAESEWAWRAVLTAAAGFTSAACAWWLYFHRADPSVITRAVRGNKRALVLSFVYGYSHLLVFAGITASGVGVQSAIEAVASGESASLGLEARIALCGGAAVMLLGMGLIDWAAPNPLLRIVLIRRGVASVGALVLIALGGLIAASTLVAILAVLIVVLTVVEGMEGTEQGQAAAEERDLAAY